MLKRSKIPRRCGIERRVFKYTTHVPERRSGKERRRRFDRRSKTSIIKWV